MSKSKQKRKTGKEDLKKELPKFPDLIPDSIKKIDRWVYENANLETEEAISELIANLYDHPENDFFLFRENDQPIKPLLQNLIDTNAIIVTETQTFFYPHPNFKCHYVKIERNSIRWDWEREVIAEKKVNFRHQLRLSEKSRRLLEMQQLIKMQNEANDAGPLKLEPNFMGFGIDLKKAYTWLMKKANK
jgi:hypothetical protein